MTHAEKGTGDRSEIGGLSSTPKACLGERERASDIIHAAGVRVAFLSSAQGAVEADCEGTGNYLAGTIRWSLWRRYWK